MNWKRIDNDIARQSINLLYFNKKNTVNVIKRVTNRKIIKTNDELKRYHE